MFIIGLIFFARIYAYLISKQAESICTCQTELLCFTLAAIPEEFWIYTLKRKEGISFLEALIHWL